ncbi:G protein beta subunit-like [Cryptococcus wingfieldii CBS 7118]|uniref:G protein beta subunit-like n=1 Tax=Cryptococcus wingfieldii CBS 7118 TaxID=1295528 RepID=A0A1E3INK7_9TREE|nr:G protein beta subunit-like [Cryptococcus wingfieldii CBS 7118]ODN90172.1 G protein beta subunit-like [Cryptococcus wingfieldii CBS 7118]
MASTATPPPASSQEYTSDSAQGQPAEMSTTIRYDFGKHGVVSAVARSHCNQAGQKQVNRLAISPNKAFVAAAGNNTVRIWDISSMSNTPIASLEGHSGNVVALAYSALGKWIVTGGEDGCVKVWDTRTAQTQRMYTHDCPVNDVVIHPNQGELISCDQSGSVKIWDLAENSCTHELVPDEDVPIRTVCISSDGNTLLTISQGMVYVWRIIPVPNANANLIPVTSFRAHTKYITRCILSPDTKYLATCSADHTVKVWSTAGIDYTLEKTLVGHQRWVWDAAFSADSAYLVTASSDHAARLWDLSLGETVRQYDGHHRAAVCCALNDINLA